MSSCKYVPGSGAIPPDIVCISQRHEFVSNSPIHWQPMHISQGRGNVIQAVFRVRVTILAAEFSSGLAGGVDVDDMEPRPQFNSVNPATAIYPLVHLHTALSLTRHKADA